MKTLEELVNTDEPGINLIREWTESATNEFRILPPTSQCDQVLVDVQVTTRSPMGAIVHSTGGLLIDDGWLRILGSGHPELSRTLPGWNQGKLRELYLIADDAAGGFFAIDGGAFGQQPGQIFF